MTKQDLQEQLKQSMLARDELKTSVLRMLLSAVSSFEMNRDQAEYDKKLKEVGENNVNISSKYIANEQDIEGILQNQAKQRRDSIAEFSKAGRQELVDKETKELEILSVYLPAQMSEEEVKKLVEEAVAQTGATTMADIGKVMGALMPKTKGKADGNLVNKIVREKLSSVQ